MTVLQFKRHDLVTEIIENLSDQSDDVVEALDFLGIDEVKANAFATKIHNNGDKSLLFDIDHSDKGFFSAQNVTSVWLRYFCTGLSNDTIWVKNLQTSQLVRDARYYSRLWASYQIEYVILDLSIKDGAKNNPREFLQMLSDSDFFRMIWQNENLYLFSNEYIGDKF